MNLLHPYQIAAVEKPTIHLWETGITRITRHPQFVGQLIWCVAHTGEYTYHVFHLLFLSILFSLYLLLYMIGWAPPSASPLFTDFSLVLSNCCSQDKLSLSVLPAYIGTSFMCATSAMLCAHHLFAVWNGDRRLKEKVTSYSALLKRWFT